MKTVQLTPNLRLLQLNDENGDFTLLVAHTGEHVHYTIQCDTKEELTAAIESFIEKPVGAFN